MKLCSMEQGTVSLHGAILYAVSGCCKYFQQCQIAHVATLARLGSTHPVALKITSRECFKSNAPRSKGALSGLTLRHMSASSLR